MTFSQAEIKKVHSNFPYLCYTELLDKHKVYTMLRSWDSEEEDRGSTFLQSTSNQLAECIGSYTRWPQSKYNSNYTLQCIWQILWLITGDWTSSLNKAKYIKTPQQQICAIEKVMKRFNLTNNSLYHNMGT
jgi:hypothetical protein